MRNEKKAIVEEVAEALLNPQKKVVFLFGAGASLPSGIPGSEILKKNLWRDKLALRPKEKVCDSLRKIGINIETDENINIEQITFEQLMTVACDLETGTTQEEKEREIAKWLETQTQIPDVYTSKTRYFPSYAYEFVSHLMNNSLVKHAINMNYDEILDKVIDDELGKGRCLKVVTLEDFELLRNTDKWEEIADYFLIKPHGTRSMRRSCRYRIEYVQQFEEDKRQVLIKVLENSMLILLGFEALDYDFRNLLADLGLNRIQKIIVVKKNPDDAIKTLGCESEQICGYRGHDEDFFKLLADALYGEKSDFQEEYNKFFTKATRHFIRAHVYKQVNPTNDAKKKKQEVMRKRDPLFFERLNLLIELLIYCFKVRGLFTRRALSTCSRIVSALDDYIKRTNKNGNPIEYLFQELEKEDILKPKKKNVLESWHFIPAKGDENPQDLFKNAAIKASEFLAQKLIEFFDSDEKKTEFIKQLTDLLTRLPDEFDYDLSKDISIYFLPLKNVELITRREEFRKKTEEIFEMSKDGTLYIISPSAAEWVWKWGKNLANLSSSVKIIINKDVYEIQGSLHFKHIHKMVEELKREVVSRGGIWAAKEVRYGLTLAYKEHGEEKITGKALAFFRDGKASAFGPIFIEESGVNKEINKSDIYRLKIFFEDMLAEGEKL
ncbi:MAG: hypothetical protein AB1633_07960 [Elusimicrobiota bacterium]